MFIPVVLGNALPAALLGKFKGADDAFDIVGVDGLCRLGIHFLQTSVQFLCSAPLRFFLHGTAAFCVSVHFRKIDPVEQGLDIKSRSANQKGQASFGINLPGCGFRLLLKTDHIPGIRRVGDIDQIVRDPLHLFFCYLGGTDVHSPVYLHGIR